MTITSEGEDYIDSHPFFKDNVMAESKKLEIVFAPGCFDKFTGTQEELDKLVAEIKAQVENGTLLEEGEELSDEEIEEMETYSPIKYNSSRVLH